MASLSPIDPFVQFDKSSLVRLAELYPDDFSYIVKTASRNSIGDEFLSDCLVCFIEKQILGTVTNETIIPKYE
ncbi:hypothetical protein Bca4012_009775 [Brassica carinata]